MHPETSPIGDRAEVRVMAGRPPTPIAVHKARGSFRKHRHAGKLTVEDRAIGEPPSWFTPTMTEEWARLGALPHIKAAHAVAVQHACVLYDRFVQDAAGTRDMTASERNTFHSVYMQLACTPASAAKVPAEPAAEKDDPWAKLG
jgi:hypothetical protein